MRFNFSLLNCKMAGTLLVVVFLLAPLVSAQSDDRVQRTAALFLAEVGDLVLDVDRAFERLTAPKVALEERIAQGIVPRDLLQGLFRGSLQRRIGEAQRSFLDQAQRRIGEAQRSVGLLQEEWESRLQRLTANQQESIGDAKVIREAPRSWRTSTQRSMVVPVGRDHYYSGTLHRRVSEDVTTPSYEELNVNPLVKEYEDEY